MFDSDRAFGLQIPLLARASPALLYAILGTSARQMERKEGRQNQFESLELYQEAIKLLAPLLLNRDHIVIPTCVMLCVLEMLSARAQDWRRHLEGCASLFSNFGIHGFSGGLLQAVFWCYARMGTSTKPHSVFVVILYQLLDERRVKLELILGTLSQIFAGPSSRTVLRAPSFLPQHGYGLVFLRRAHENCSPALRIQTVMQIIPCGSVLEPASLYMSALFISSLGSRTAARATSSINAGPASGTRSKPGLEICRPSFKPLVRLIRSLSRRCSFHTGRPFLLYSCTTLHAYYSWG